MANVPEGISESAGSLHNLDDVIACLQQLIPYVVELEKRLAKCESGPISSLRKLEYRVGKLFIKELSGTLNIGITSIDRDVNITDLAPLTTEDLTDGSAGGDEESWYRDEGWFGEAANFDG